MKRKEFNILITTCYDCPYKIYGIRKCGKTGIWFEYFEIEKGIVEWCPMLKGEQK